MINLLIKNSDTSKVIIQTEVEAVPRDGDTLDLRGIKMKRAGVFSVVLTTWEWRTTRPDSMNPGSRMEPTLWVKEI